MQCMALPKGIRLLPVLLLLLTAGEAPAGASCRADALGNMVCRSTTAVGDGRAALPRRSVLGEEDLEKLLAPEAERPRRLPAHRRDNLGGVEFGTGETLGGGSPLTPGGDGALRCRPDNLGNLSCR
jgi:hypothetical protein